MIGFLIEWSLLTMVATCVWRDGELSMRRLADNESVFDRVAMITMTANSYSRLYSKDLASLDDWNELVTNSYPLRDQRPKINREKLTQPNTDEQQPDQETMAWWGSRNHRDVRARSIIDYHLWNKAGWKGVLFTSSSSRMPPAIGFLFEDREAATMIFERWRERFGEIDRNDEIYLSIIQNVSNTNPAHYNVLITSGLKPSEALQPGGTMVLSRFNRMQPDSDTNLRHFLSVYEKTGVYLLIPAVMERGKPQLLFAFSILKRGLVVKSARDVGLYDVEQSCLGEEVERHFANTAVEPSSSEE